MYHQYFGIFVFVLISEVSRSGAQPWGSAPSQCLVQSYNRYGEPAYCDVWSNVRCPNYEDRCNLYPGTSYGPCCLGCMHGPPAPGRRCGGWGGARCPEGFFCKTSRFIYDGLGICCPGGYSLVDDDYKPDDIPEIYEDLRDKDVGELPDEMGEMYGGIAD